MPAQPESDGGLHYLEQKLRIFTHGSAQARRNAALDILTGRVADDQSMSAGTSTPSPHTPTAPVPVAPTRIHPGPPRRAVRPLRTAADVSPAVESMSRPSASPWLAASDVQRPALRLQRPAPPPSTRCPRARSVVLGALGAGALLALGLGGRTIYEGAAPQNPETILVQAAPDASEPVVGAQTASAPMLVATVLPIVPTASPPAPASVLGPVIDERFASNARAWPNDPQSTAWLADGTYRLAARQPSHFVAVGIPGTQALGDTVLTGWFHKVGGLAGGGYGLILRDQSPELRDGQNQSGRYYVFEVGDRGEVGVWLRDGDHWVDLLTWTASSAVKPGSATNELTVTATGDHLSFVVNGIPVASQTDTLLRRGAAGVFVGGDTNEVAVDRIALSSSR